MNRKYYEKPTMQVIVLRHTKLLTGSVDATNSINDWDNGDTINDDIYM